MVTYDAHHQPGGSLTHSPAVPAPGDLEDARRDFPRYLIHEELHYDRRRYVARRTQPGPGPHTLITSDLAELRAELTPASPPGRQAQRWTTILDGHRLRQLRRQQGLSQEQLAGQAGISLTTMRRLERHPASPCRCRTLARLAAVLGEDPARLTPTGHR
jgi:DNA-binding XRE family transcriptional regulator